MLTPGGTLANAVAFHLQKKGIVKRFAGYKAGQRYFGHHHICKKSILPGISHSPDERQNFHQRIHWHCAQGIGK